MERRTFLKRVGLVVGGLAVGRNLPLPESAPVVESVVRDLHIVRDSTLNSVNEFQMFSETFTASGGLCAPFAPIYDLPSFARPIREALPMFTAARGGITSPE